MEKLNGDISRRPAIVLRGPEPDVDVSERPQVNWTISDFEFDHAISYASVRLYEVGVIGSIDVLIDLRGTDGGAGRSTAS